jgi:transposase-like protein
VDQLRVHVIDSQERFNRTVFDAGPVMRAWDLPCNHSLPPAPTPAPVKQSLAPIKGLALSPEARTEILRLLDTGLNCSEVARETGVSSHTVGKIKKGSPLPKKGGRKRVEAPLVVSIQPDESRHEAVREPVRESTRTDALMWISRMRAQVFDGPVSGPKRIRRVKIMSHAAMCEALGQRYHGQPIEINCQRSTTRNPF